MVQGAYGHAGGDRKPSRAPQAAVGVFIIKGGSSILLGERLTPVGRGTFSVPGGRLEFGETFEEAGAREVMEETGLDIKDIEVLSVANMVSDEPREPYHFVSILLRAILADPDQEPENRETDKCRGWGWYRWDELPKPLSRPLEKIVKGGFNPFTFSKPVNHSDMKYIPLR